MFLSVTYDRNPMLIKASAALHMEGRIMPNTYVVDLDSFESNTEVLVKTAQENGIQLYHMTKQQGRNPLLAQAAAKHGMDKIVAVDFNEAMVMHRNNIKIGHIGHLVQIPDAMIPTALDMKPEVITIYSKEKARRISDEAKKRGVVQDILIRIHDDGDTYHPSQYGGITLERLCDEAREINAFGGVKIVGLTSFPCAAFDEKTQAPAIMSNMHTLLRAKSLLEEKMGIKVEQMNTPSFTCCAVIPMLKELGGTHMEPGSCMTGNTPLHAIDYSQPEIPAMVYVSEISHILGDKAYCYGGGFYRRNRMQSAFVGGDAYNIADWRYKCIADPPEVIDYHGTLLIEDQPVPKIGDTVIYAFRSQVFVSHSNVAIVSGLKSGKVKLEGIFDHTGSPVNSGGRA